MFQLRTLGGLFFADASGLEVPLQRRRLAFLACLATAGDTGRTRDQVVALFWPESSQANARHALEQLIYGLRRQFGNELLLGPDPLRLHPSLVASDICRFDQALASGALAQAVEAYQGPFLDGFYLTDAPEFDRWKEEERARRAGQYAKALESLADEAARRGAPVEAVDWWRKRASLDPLDGRIALAVVRALVHSGDRPGAFHHARVHEALVRHELDAGPDPALSAFLEELKQAPATHGALAIPAPAPEPIPSAPPPIRSSRMPATGTRILIALLTVVAGVWLGWRRVGGTRAATVEEARIAIAPFAVSGPDSSLRYLSEGMPDLLSATLTGAAGFAAVDPRASLRTWKSLGEPADDRSDFDRALRMGRALGSDHVLLGTLVETGAGRIRLSARLLSTRDGHLRALSSVTGPLDSLPALADHLGATLLSLQAGEGEQRLPVLTSAPLPALRAYLEGRAAYRGGESQKAVRLYTRALALDSNFTLAALELVSAEDRLLRWRLDHDYGIPLGRNMLEAGAQQAWAHAVAIAKRGEARLSERDRAYLEALIGSTWPTGFARARLADWERAVDAAPDRADAWYRLGEILLYQGPSVGVPEPHARARAAFTRALSLDPGFPQPLAGLIALAALQHDTAEMRLLSARYLAEDSVGPTADYVRWHLAAATGDKAALGVLRRRFGALDFSTLDRIQWTVQVEGLPLRDGDSAFGQIMGRLAQSDERVIALFSQRMLALNEGRPGEALRITDGMNTDSATYWTHRLMYAMYWGGDTANIGQIVSHLGFPNWLVAQWALWQGDTAGVPKVIAALRASRDSYDRIRADLLDAMAAVVLHRPDARSLLRRADSLSANGCCNVQMANLIVAHLEERVGDLPGALRAVRRQAWVYPPLYLSSALEQEGRLAAMTGDRAGAMRAYRHYLALRTAPEPQALPEVRRVRAELGRLEAGR